MCDLVCDTTILVSPSSNSVQSEEFQDKVPPSLLNQELQLALNQEATEDELLKAIEKCKNLVLESNQCSVERKWLVRHLIELRLRLQECREAMEDPQHPYNKKSGVSKRTIKGHHLVLQPLLKNAKQGYCDHCTGNIWGVVQAWYECKDCGYCCHYKCMDSIIRECAHVIATERGQYELEICPELGLSAQKYCCAECKVPLPINKEWSEARRCDYTGLYYCSACHWGSSAVIPARVIHNWDLEPRPVSQTALQQLRVMADRPLINLETLNSRLFSLVHELSLVKRLRNELSGIRKYLLVCRNAQKDHLLWKYVESPHLVESKDMYSLQDLVDTHSGELPTKLTNMVDIFLKHIKNECEICKGRGHICAICNNDEVIFPFDNTANVCQNCQTVLHNHCVIKMKEKNDTCPKCKRINLRKEKEARDINNGNL